MKAIFADAFFWIALTNPADLAHRQAQEFADTLSGTLLVTTDEVLIEFLTFFRTSAWLRSQASRTVHGLLRKKSVRIIPQTRDSFISGLDLYRARPDKAYSLTDCISMQTMRHEGLSEVLTNDRHFEQEGFRPLFRA